MNKHVKGFLLKGLLFAGFGPVVTSIVYAIVGAVTKENLITTNQFLLATISTYIMAFLIAGASEFYHIEKMGFSKASLLHFICLYLAYLIVYLSNSWIAFKWASIAIFTAVFVIGYFIIWLIIYLSIKKTADQLNGKIK